MRNKFYCQRHLITLLFLSIPVVALASEQLEEIQVWLEKMHRATHTLNFIGTFVYGQRDQLSSVKVIHRVTPQGEQERLISMDGSGREVIRDGNQVTCIMPDTRAVVVGKSRPEKKFPPVFPMKLDELKNYYQFSLTGSGQVAGRKTQLIAIKPLDQYRYGHELWIDSETGLLLKTQLLNENGKPVEQFVFTNIEYRDSIDDAMMQSSNDGRDYTWYEEKSSSDKIHDKSMESIQVGWLPPGFVHDMKKMKKLPNTAMPVEHLVFSDGLASVSVFIEEEIQHDPANLIGGTRVGAVSAHGRILGDYHVTVVGEVPHITVKKISGSVEYSAQDD